MTMSANTQQQTAVPHDSETNRITCFASAASHLSTNLPAAETGQEPVYHPEKAVNNSDAFTVLLVGSDWTGFSWTSVKNQLKAGTVIQNSFSPGIFVLVELPQRPTAWLGDIPVTLDGSQAGAQQNAVVLAGRVGNQIRVIDSEYILAGNIRYRLDNIAITVGQAKARELFKGNNRSERFLGAHPDVETREFLKRHKLLPAALLDYLGSGTPEFAEEQAENSERLAKGDRWIIPDDIHTDSGNDLIAAYAGSWKGGEDSDYYIVMKPSSFGLESRPEGRSGAQVKIDNHATDMKMDTLYLPVTAQGLNVQTTGEHLMLAFADQNQWVICQVTDFMRGPLWQHLQIVDKTDRVFNLEIHENQLQLINTGRQFIPQANIMSNDDKQAVKNRPVAAASSQPGDIIMTDAISSWPDRPQIFTMTDVMKDLFFPVIRLVSSLSAL